MCVQEEQRTHGKGKSQANQKGKGKIPPQADIKKDSKCFFCKKKGHMKKKCAKFQKWLEDKGDSSDGSVTELESRDVNFLENEFPNKGEVDKDVRFFELDDLNDDVNLNTPIEVNTKLPGTSVPNGSNTAVEPTFGDLQTRKSNRRAIPHYHFEIEGETFVVASHDSDEPKNANEALNSPAKELWMKVMEEEMESMKNNHV
ncbi:hypothetical protein LWI28_025254 [Acer negundo]|uniref:CCHC-type domain-containing protein n=1 Tax=Acer negundo TaxID=4023 RepID=A0AAD5NNB3_ACENE|nr:hypothetical protein LWI28_025254 [Acer negundo]